ncbi:MAG: tetratricopeptide repeat protein [Chitinophagales bacterium]
MSKSFFRKSIPFITSILVCLFFVKCKPTPNTNIIESDDYLTFAQMLADSIDDSNASFFNKYFDVDSIANSILDSIHGPKITKEGFKKGVTDHLDVGVNIVSAMGIDGHCKLLKVTKDSIPKALYRIVSQGGVNYFEVFLQKNKQDSTIQIIDYYPYAVGQQFSNTLRRIYLSSLSDLRDSINIDSLSQSDSLYVSHIPTLDKIGTLFEKGQFNDALALIDSFPPTIREDKMIQITKLNIAFNEGGETYSQTAEAFKQTYPKDPIVEVMLLDFAFAQKEHTKALTVIDSLDKKIGGDPYLKVMKSAIYEDLEKNEVVESLLKEVIATEASMEEPYWKIIALYIEQKQYDKAIALFPQMQELFNINPAEFLVYDGYSDFWESNIYKNWAITNPIDSVKLHLK